MATPTKKFPLNLALTSRYLKKKFTGSQENLHTEVQRRPSQNSSSGNPNLLSVGSSPNRPTPFYDMNSLPRSSSATDVTAETEAETLISDAEDTSLSQSIRLLIQALDNLKTVIASSTDMSREMVQADARDKLNAVLSTIKGTFTRFPGLQTAEILAALKSLIEKIEDCNFNGSSQFKEEVFGIISNLGLIISNSLSDCLTGPGTESVSLTKTKSLNCLLSNENKVVGEQGAKAHDPGVELEMSVSEILDDSMLYKVEPGVEIALQRAQAWSKYSKELVSYVERRINLWGDFSRSLLKLAKSVEQAISEDTFLPMQALFCTALTQDIELASMSQGARSLILNQTFVTTLNARRMEHDKVRKNLKTAWTKQVRKLHDSITNLRKAKSTYVSRQQDYEKIKELAQKAESESLTLSLGGGPNAAKADAKVEKKKKQEDEAMQKAVEAETAYKQCVRDANDQQKHLEEIKRYVLRCTRELLVKSDAVLKEATSGYFKLMNTITEMIPTQFNLLNSNSQQYEEGSHYLEYINQLQVADLAPAEVRTFHFEPYALKSDHLDAQSDTHSHQDISRVQDSDSISGGSTASLESSPTTSPYPHQSKRINASSSMADLACEDDHSNKFDMSDDAPMLFRGVRLSLDAQTHSFRKLRISTPVKCAHCENLVYSHGAECEKCGLTSHKKCLEIMRIVCSIQEVPFLVVKCVREIDKRGLSTKGIYRISSVKSRVELVCQSFELDGQNVDLSDQPPNIIANVLKLYLRQLREPLLTFRLYHDFIQLAKDEEVQGSSGSHLLSSVSQLIDRLPPVHKKTCNILMHHLNRVSKNHEVNQMTSANLGIVFGPTLLRPKEGAASIDYLIETPYQTRIIELLIVNAQAVFGPDEGTDSAICGQVLPDIRRKKLGVRTDSASESTSPGYSSWYAPEITSDLLGELAKEQPHFLQLQEGHSLCSEPTTPSGNGADVDGQTASDDKVKFV